MLIALVGAMVAVSCIALWSLRLFLHAGERGVHWIGQDAEAQLAQQFVFISSRRLLAIATAGAAFVTAGGLLLRIPVVLVMLLSGLVLAAPRLWAVRLRARRQRRLVAQLPDALQLWAGLLRSGQGMMAALSQLSSRQAEPLGAELRIVLGECRLGSPLDKAMHSLQARIATGDLRMLTTLLRVHRDMGGNLAEALERLAATLRSRLAMETRIQSVTAQGRMQGVIVGLLPVLLAGVLSIMEPDAMHALVSTPAGLSCIAVIVALEAAGFVLIRRIVKIDV